MAAKSGGDPADPILAKPHPLRRTFRVLALVGVVLTLYPALQAMILPGLLFGGDPTLLAAAIGELAAGLFFTAYATYALRLLPGIQLVNAALNRITTGHYDDAEALLQRAEVRSGPFGRASSPSAVRRMVALHRAVIALGRGDLDGATTHAGAALTLPGGLWERSARPVATLRALGVRSLARALSGDGAGARADIDQLRELARTKSLGAGVLAGESTLTDPLARAGIAEAVLLARANEHDALRALLASSGKILFEHSLPRERALLRGLERQLAATTTTPYRAGPRAERPTEGDEPAAHDWIERVLPEVASFVARTNEPTRVEPAPAPEPATIVAPPPLVAAQPSARRWIRIASALAIAAGIAAVTSLGGSSGGRTGSHDGAPLRALTQALPSLIPLAIALLVARSFARLRQARFALTTAYRALAEGRTDEATRILRGLPAAAPGTYHGLAALSLARLAMREGRPEEALALAEWGLRAIDARRARAASSDVVVPELVTERAVAMAIVGRPDEALALADTLPPDFAFRARSLFRVRLFASIARDRIDEAAGIAHNDRATLPIDPRTELVADLARACTSPEGLGLAVLRRLRGDVMVPEARTFLARTTPRLLERFEREESTRVDDESSAIDREERAIDEAEASDTAARIGRA